MNFQVMHRKMHELGFVPFQSNLNDMILYGKSQDDTMHICCMVMLEDKRKTSVQSLQDVHFQIERKLLLQGFRKVEFLFAVFTMRPDVDCTLMDEQYNLWIVNQLNGQVMIFENQPEDFCGLRKPIEEMLREEWELQQKNKVPFPMMTAILILVNVILFFIIEKIGSTNDTELMLQWGAANGKLIIEEKQYYRLFTSMFLHFGFDHLLNNMIMLYFVGSLLECHMRKLSFVTSYLCSGLIASLVSTLYYYRANQDVVSAGASGAVYGIIGLLIVMVFFHRGKLEGLYFPRVVVMAILVLYSGVYQSNVDVVAHVAGFVCGILFGIILYMMRIVIRNSIRSKKLQSK